MENFYLLLPLIFKTQNRINSQILKHKEKYFIKYNLEHVYLQYKEKFENLEILASFIYENYLQPIPKVKTSNACLECNNKTAFCSFSQGYNDFCSIKCSQQSKLTQEKYKQTCLEKYGEVNAMFNADIKHKQIKAYNKIPKEVKRKTFVEFHKKLNENPDLKEKHYSNISNKIKDTLTKNPNIVSKRVEKYKETCKNVWGVSNSSQKHIKNFKDLNEDFWRNRFIKDNLFLFDEAKIYHNIQDNAVYTYKRSFNIKEKTPFHESNVSKPELAILEKLQTQYTMFSFENSNRNIIKNPKTNRYFELDIVVYKGESILCAVEYNGAYWHDKENPHKENLKSELCNKQGFKLFHIWEDTENEDLHNVFEYLDNNVC